MSVIAKVSVQTNPPIVASTITTLTLCQFDVTSLPGIGVSLVAPYVIHADVLIFMTALFDTSDHGSRIWTQKVIWDNAMGLGFRVMGGGAYSTIGPTGGAYTHSPMYNVSGNIGRCQIVPDNTGGTWYAKMDLTIMQG